MRREYDLAAVTLDGGLGAEQFPVLLDHQPVTRGGAVRLLLAEKGGGQQIQVLDQSQAGGEGHGQ